MVFPSNFPGIFPGVETPPSLRRPRRAAAQRFAAAEQRPRGTRPRGGVEAILAATHARRGHTHSDTWDETSFVFLRFFVFICFINFKF